MKSRWKEIKDEKVAYDEKGKKPKDKKWQMMKGR